MSDQRADDVIADDFDIIADDIEIPEVMPGNLLYCDRCDGICSCPLDMPPWNQSGKFFA